ncbi:riboflavin synthase [Facilibium subflavum]|uniref:riboflavin synthase n=1 Tax=Facilibium subflavum TaxID=2219058 RepID=UPI000E652670|nr:riboflavin synthase [Facilibium subflavum]
MFSGIVQEIGVINRLEKKADLLTLWVKFSQAHQCRIGDSVAINGICLTVVEVDEQQACFEAVAETLQKTNLAYLSDKDYVNIELSLRYGDFIGGHMVQGHVDGVGEIRFIELQGDALLVGINADKNILCYLVNKGFVAIDGMSITVIDVFDQYFTVTFIPHTQKSTIVQHYQVGMKVNLEADPIGKHIHTYMEKYRYVSEN